MTDIRPYGAGEGVGFYWVRQDNSVGRTVAHHLALKAIDEVGNITETGTRAPDDEAAPGLGEAVMEHLADGIKQADAVLEKRRAKLSDQPTPEPSPPIDPATARFYYDPD